MSAVPAFDLSQLKTQIMTMFMMKPPGQGQGQQGQQDNGIYTVIYTMLLMNFVEWVFRIGPSIFLAIKVVSIAYFAKKKNAIPMLNLNSGNGEKEIKSITLTRSYAKGASENNINIEKVDGVLDYISNIDNVKHIRLTNRYLINTRDEFPVTNSIRAKVEDVKYDESGELVEITIKLTSAELTINDLRKWIDEVHSKFCMEKDNKLGKKKFYFNEVPLEPPRDNSVSFLKDVTTAPNEPKYRLENAPRSLIFSMNEFKTSKSFKNIFGHHVQELKERLDLFVNNPEWYEQRGIPHSLGIMLYGIPGAGKTSTIKAIAKDTNRHIFNLSLRPYTTQRQMMNLFFNENIHVQGDDGQKQTYRIPLDQRVFVIEDIDCLTNVVYQRTADSANDDAQNSSEAITLSFLLNLLDGVLETPGRILIITSNFPEKLDKALVRPGRIDVKIRFENASCELIASMINNFYGTNIGEDNIPAKIENRLTPAEALECLCTNFKSYTGAIDMMVTRVKEKEEAEAEAEAGEKSSMLSGTSPQACEGEEEKSMARALKYNQELVEELVASIGLQDILDYAKYNPEYQKKLETLTKDDLIDGIQEQHNRFKLLEVRRKENPEYDSIKLHENNLQYHIKSVFNYAEISKNRRIMQIMATTMSNNNGSMYASVMDAYGNNAEVSSEDSLDSFYKVNLMG
jgi:hypothetical protein